MSSEKGKKGEKIAKKIKQPFANIKTAHVCFGSYSDVYNTEYKLTIYREIASALDNTEVPIVF